ncbi:branched-chain amino acid ABC transporter permease [Rhizobium sp. P40RR-XXII]|uniref:branched-chain amino acid ABC transporter permease n=1 Tax=unclassified Rhizobium TaxID=2613769 RepID=UPI0014563CD8|nr:MULTISPECIES: branched-chain amino acid ABC transporter permease [unclassified Rhizobium]NLR89143.1 branched-chain amino acid ABC transporter permease [Rhizobium sp. P28RR-XV]NLS21039.1 branched-chain amino acid ABC transporter permease [Rhizobium sp. P40RR-XXII]
MSDHLSPSWTVSSHTRGSSALMLVILALVVFAIAAPFFVSRSVVQDLFFILTMLVLAQCWNLLAGYAGLVSVGQQAFVGFGAYAMFAGVSLLGMDPMAAVMLGGLAALALSVPTAFFVFRLQGAYFAIGTWVIAEIVRLSLAQWKALGGGTGTSLPSGATRDMFGVRFVADLLGVRGPQATDIVCYWLALLLTVVTIGSIYKLLSSKQGLGLAAVRDNSEAARSVGVDPLWTKSVVYLVAAMATGLAGALIYVQKARISPDAAFSVPDWTAYVIFIVVIGGIGTIEGPIIGVMVFYILQNLLADYGSWYLLILGLIGILIMLFAPRGLWGLFTDHSGIQLFPVRRILAGQPKTKDIKGSD